MANDESTVARPLLLQARARRSRLRVLEAALDAFAARGWEATTFQHIAAEAGVSPALVCRYFPTKELLVLAAYDLLADELTARVVELDRGSIAERFRHVMEAKLELLEARRDAYVALAGRALDRSAREGVLGPGAEWVRARVGALFAALVDGADDAPDDAAARARMARALYATHLLLVLIWTQDLTRARATTCAALALVSEGLVAGSALLPLVLGGPLGERADAIARAILAVPRAEREDDRATAIVRRLLRGRRVLPGVPAEPSAAALALHLPVVRAAIAERRPLELVLPAFPAKAPNPRKVLGKVPDAAEELALGALGALVEELRALHPPGVSLVLCSDGHVFADAVGVGDADVSRYRRELDLMTRSIVGDALRSFALEDVSPVRGHAASRAWLLERWADPVERIRERATASPTLRAQVDGIHRFLVEDARGADPSLTASQARKRTRELAYEVVRRSEAWGRLVGATFPGAVRLSIHPQPDVSDKIGVHLLSTEDAWLTPWHGVAVFDGTSWSLAHRADAEARGAIVVEEDGRPWSMAIGAGA